MKIFIGMPCNRSVKPKTVESIVNMVARGGHEFKIVIATEGYTIAENRSYLVAQAKGYDYLLFIDDDMIFPPDTLEKLLAHKKEIVGVLSFSRMNPPVCTVEFLDNNLQPSEKELFEVKTVGAGVLLIDMMIFNSPVNPMDKPYFSFEIYDFGMTKMGEDAWFCRQAKNKGRQIWCDPTIKVKHIGDCLY